MASYFTSAAQRLGLVSSEPAQQQQTAPAPPAPTLVEPEQDDDDDDEVPSFPLPNSIQRAGGSSSKPGPSLSLSAPALSLSVPDYDSDEDESNESPALPPKFQEKSSLGAPASTTTKGKRVKVAIEKGYSQLDWARLKSSGADLRGGVTQLSRVTVDELAQHNTKDDCWQAYGGKVYNVTPYLKYHPGGVGQLMKAAGKDGTELFMKTHAWVNWDLMLDTCLVGFLVRD